MITVDEINYIFMKEHLEKKERENDIEQKN